MSKELTDAQIDTLLERFDRTAPAMQRRIVAKLCSDNAALLAVCQMWSDYFQKLDDTSDPDDPLTEQRKRYHGKRIEATRVAIAKAKP